MKLSFKPQIEQLEDRVVLAGDVSGDVFIDIITSPSTVEIAPDVSGRVTSIAVDPLEVSHSDNEWIYVPVRRTSLDEEPTSLGDKSAIVEVEGWGSSSYQYSFEGTYVGTANGGVWKTTDGGASLGELGNDWIVGGTGQDGQGSAAQHEVGHLLGLHHQSISGQ
jgi:hypothetical protein